MWLAFHPLNNPSRSLTSLFLSLCSAIVKEAFISFAFSSSSSSSSSSPPSSSSTFLSTLVLSAQQPVLWPFPQPDGPPPTLYLPLSGGTPRRLPLAAALPPEALIELFSSRGRCFSSFVQEKFGLAWWRHSEDGRLHHQA